MATAPIREPILPLSVPSILAQVDHLFVYLHGYDWVPKILQQPKVTVVSSRDNTDFGPAGKFWWIGKVTTDYYFGVDDDIYYPPDYVERMCEAIDVVGIPVIVGVHGIRLNPSVKSYFKDREVWHFRKGLDKRKFVHVLGTGTCAFRPCHVDIRVGVFKIPFMVDIILAVEAKTRAIPMLCVSRPNNWLKSIPDVPGPTLYERYRNNDAPHTKVIRCNLPWPLLEDF